MTDYSIFEKESPFAEPPEETEIVPLEKLEEEDSGPEETPEKELEKEPGPAEESQKPTGDEGAQQPAKPDETPGAAEEGEAGPAEAEPEKAESESPKEIELDGELVALDDVREALKERGESHARYREAKALMDQIKLFREDITRDPAKTLHALFTQVFGGDARKAFDHVASIAERIVYDKIQLEDMPDAAKDAFFSAHEAKVLKTELEQLRREKNDREKGEKEKQELDRQVVRLTSLLKGEGLEPSQKNIGRLATIILQERADGLPDDEKRSLRKLIVERKVERQEILATLKAGELSEEIKEAIRRESVEEVKKRSGPAANTGKPKPKGRSKRSYTRYATGGFLDAIRSMKD